jgi:glycosyltransferase involved in cell wall biosynthesis
VGGVELTVLTRDGASLGAARNVGLAHADAEFVVFLDADDAMIPGALAAMVAAARHRPSADVFFGHFLPVSGVVWPPRRKARLMPTPLALPMLLANNTLPMTGTLLRRRALPLDLFPPVRSEDWPAAVRMRARSRVVFLDRAVMDYATHHGSRSRSRIDRAEIIATRRELLVALLRERRGAAFWRVVDRLADRRRHRLDAELAVYDHVPAVPVPQQ